MGSAPAEHWLDSGGDTIGMTDHLALEERCQRLRQETTDLYDALEGADLAVQRLLEEVASEREQNNSLQRENTQLKDLLKETDNLKLVVEQSKEAVYTAQQQKAELERRSLQMEERAEQLTNQISDCGYENKSLRDQVTGLRLRVTELEVPYKSYYKEINLQRKTLELKEKEESSQKRDSVVEEMTLTVNEYSDIIEVLNSRIRALQVQQEQTRQEIALKSVEQTMALSPDPAADGTLMYEMVQANLEKQLRQSHWEKEQKSRSFIRSLCNMLLQLLCWYLKVFFISGFLLFFFYYLMELIHTKDPNFLRRNIGSVCSAQTMDMIQEFLQKLFPSFLALSRPGVVPL